MIREFQYYLAQGLVKRTTANVALAKALLEKGKTRLERVTKTSLTKEFASLLLEDSYEAVREAAQSLMQLEGFKPYSHEALIAFLKSKNYTGIDINKLDRFRILRNKSVYEAEEFSLETCKEALDFAQESLPKIKTIFQKVIEEIK